MPHPAPDRQGPLAGIRILDLTQALSGPFCTMMLADLGADVVKVEPPGGERTRGAPPFTAEDTERAYGGYFASINRGKRSIVLDLKDDADRAVFLELVRTADVVVETAAPGSWTGWASAMKPSPPSIRAWSTRRSVVSVTRARAPARTLTGQPTISLPKPWEVW